MLQHAKHLKHLVPLAKPLVTPLLKKIIPSKKTVLILTGLGVAKLVAVSVGCVLLKKLREKSSCDNPNEEFWTTIVTAYAGLLNVNISFTNDPLHHNLWGYDTQNGLVSLNLPDPKVTTPDQLIGYGRALEGKTLSDFLPHLPHHVKILNPRISYSAMGNPEHTIHSFQIHTKH